MGTVVAIVVICYLIGQGAKLITGIKDEFIPVIVDVAGGMYSEDYDSDKVTIYTEYNKENVYKTLKIDENFAIDESNYQSFSKYRFVFNTDLVFEKIEKLN